MLECIRNKKKILFIMPLFMDYNKIIKEDLSSYYEIDIIDGEVAWPSMIKDISRNRVTRKIRNLLKLNSINYKKKMVAKYEHMLQDLIETTSIGYDYVVCVNGQFVSKDMLELLRSRNKNAKIFLYLWDDCSNLFLLPTMEMYDDLYSYNLDDCAKYGMKYLPMYVKNLCVEHSEKKYDIAIIGSGHPDRIAFAKKVYYKYKDQFKFKIYIYDKENQTDFFSYNVPLAYEEYLKILDQSKAIIDIPSIKQGGPTTRFFDALLTNTKVITTNDRIVDYPVMSDNVFIIERNNPVIDYEFVESNYIKTDIRPINVKSWLDMMIER